MKDVLGGTEEVVITLCLAVFSIGIAVGSGSPRCAHGRIVLVPTPVGAC